jgi:hypothetical protein
MEAQASPQIGHGFLLIVLRVLAVALAHSMFMLIYVNNKYIYTACSQRRQTWAPAEGDAVGIAAQSVESGNFTAGKNVAWSLICAQVLFSAVLFASIPLGACPEAAGTVFQYLSRCLR